MLPEEPKWRIYEKAVASLKEAFGDCDVSHDRLVTGRRSGVKRQVDIWLSVTVGGRHELTVAVECRCYEKPLGIKDVDAFYGFLDDVGANKGVLVSSSGFTDGAKKRADNSTIELQVLTLEEAEAFDWADYLAEGCQSLGGCWGSIRWDESLCYEGGGQFPPPYEAGFCEICLSFHVRCGNCGYMDLYEPETEIPCHGCEVRWKLEFEKGEVIGIRQVDTRSGRRRVKRQQT